MTELDAGLGLEGRVAALVAPAILALGYELVRVKLSGAGGRRTLQVMAEPLPEEAQAPLTAPRRFMTVEDCTAISRAIEPILDVEDAVPGAYSLEVSSPGLDRPLLTLDQFRRFVGFEVKLEARLPAGGRRRFAGKLLAVADGGAAADAGVGTESVPEPQLRFAVGAEEVEVGFSAVDKAKLVINDALIAAAAGGRL